MVLAYSDGRQHEPRYRSHQTPPLRKCGDGDASGERLRWGANLASMRKCKMPEITFRALLTQDGTQQLEMVRT
jgi:hypothetical protein